MKLKSALSLLSLSFLLSCQAVDQALVGIAGKPEVSNPVTAPTTDPNALPVPPKGSLRFPATHPVPFRTKGDFLQLRNGETYQNVFLKGVNLGIGLPGTQAGDLAATREQYARWFAQMKEMGFNNVRVYTLHFPRFYEELARYNSAHPDDPLYVFHGAWLDEDESGGLVNLYNSTKHFQEGMEEVVNAIHGNLKVNQRAGRAYGDYTADVSRWVMGWIIGREISPEEIIFTNESNSSKTTFDGKHVALKGNPSEVWMAEQVDYLIDFERSKYKVDRPISVSSWPTLDPLTHPTENDEESSEDIVGISLHQIELKDAPGGYFASFHAYPYYPNFINNTPEYLTYSDAQGVNNYIGYIRDLKRHYSNMPLVVGEYGVPSSWGNAHFSPSGMHHGGHSEEDQQRYNARLTQDIYDNNLAGGMVFAWIDEWWKRTWIVDQRTMPRDRYRLWHNYTSPEENFGLIAFDDGPISFKNMASTDKNIRKIEAGHDAAFFHVKITLDKPLNSSEQLIVGYDTYRDDLGESKLPNGVTTKNRNEFSVVFENPNEAQLYVTQAYDLLGIWHNNSTDKQVYQSTRTDGAPWMPFRWQNGQPHSSKDGSMTWPLTIFELGKLGIHQGSSEPRSNDAVIVDGNQVHIRIPYNMLQFTDPSTLSVTHDNRNTRERETATSEGIALSVQVGNTLVETPRYTWSAWDTPHATTERVKKGIDVLSQTLKRLPHTF